MILPDGTQQVLAEAPSWSLPVEDLRGRRPEARLAARRAAMQQQVLPADRWPLFDVRATRYDGVDGPRLDRKSTRLNSSH